MVHVVADTEPGQNKIVANRVLGAKAPKKFRDLKGRAHIDLFPLREAEHEADLVHVRVEGHNEF